MTNLTTIEGIGEVYSGQLTEAGISTTEDMLEKAATPAGRAIASLPQRCSTRT